MIEGIPLVQVSASALLTLVVLMILTGRLVPRRTLDDTAADRDHWRRAAEERSAQITRLLTATDTSTRALEALADVTGAQETSHDAPH